MMRLLMANAILGSALAWAVLSGREPPVSEPAPVRAAAPVLARAAVPATLPIVPVPVPAPVEPAAATEVAFVPSEEDEVTGAASPEPQPVVSRAERLAALDALAAELEIFALDRRR